MQKVYTENRRVREDREKKNGTMGTENAAEMSISGKADEG